MAGIISDISAQESAFRYVGRSLFGENVSIHQIEKELEGSPEAHHSTTPLYVYSRQQLIRNIQSYQDAIERAGMTGRIQVLYAVKANANLRLLELACKQGCGAVTVSGFEIHAALAAGFQPEKILLNGNGKQMWEIELAISHGCLLNVDSIFDAENIIDSARRLRKTSRVLIRVNPGLESYSGNSSPAHHYLATALKNSKFGVPVDQFNHVTTLLKGEPLIQLVGLHCHLGSTIRDANLYGDIARVMVQMRNQLIAEGHPIKYLDIGGGLGIDYYHGTDPQSSPLSSTADLIRSISRVIPPNVDVIIEPGRSIVANTGILVTRVLGTKSRSDAGTKHFVIVDAAMNDLIRPSFYQAYHHILPVKEAVGGSGQEETYDIVGPVCESGDFLALDRPLRERPVRGDLLAVCDAGAYGMAMASNYNMRPRPLEVLIDGHSWQIIRRRERFDDLIQTAQFSK